MSRKFSVLIKAEIDHAVNNERQSLDRVFHCPIFVKIVRLCSLATHESDSEG